jgi:ankyrin repeat protein
LIAAGSIINYTDEISDSPLHMILKGGDDNLVLINALLSHGACPNQITENGEHPVCLSIKNSSTNSKLKQLLKYDLALITANSFGKIPLLEVLQEGNMEAKKLIVIYQCNKLSKIFFSTIIHDNFKLLIGFVLLTGMGYLRKIPKHQHQYDFFKSDPLIVDPQLIIALARKL